MVGVTPRGGKEAREEKEVRKRKVKGRKSAISYKKALVLCGWIWEEVLSSVYNAYGLSL